MPAIIAQQDPTQVMSPEALRDLELRSLGTHPGEPVATAGEVLGLIRALRHLDTEVTTLIGAIERVHALATDWTASPDVMQAAAGRLVLAALDGRATGRDLI